MHCLEVLIRFVGRILSTRGSCKFYPEVYVSSRGVDRNMYRFDENYALASTQSLKNKDIPEGGAKGTILPSYVSLLTRHPPSRSNQHCIIDLEPSLSCASRNTSMSVQYFNFILSHEG